MEIREIKGERLAEMSLKLSRVVRWRVSEEGVEEGIQVRISRTSAGPA